MEFIVDNIVWFIVGGVVILMTIVGYLAEKTDFANKKYREKGSQENKKKVINNEQPIEEIPDNNIENTPIQSVGIADMISKPEETVNTEKEEDLYAPLGDSNSSASVNEDLYAPLNASANEQEVNNNVVEEDLYAPLSSTPSDELSTQEVSTPIQDNEVFNTPDEVLAPVENLNDNSMENTETLEMPVTSSMDTLPINDTSDYDKIFPDDPIIINEGKENNDSIESAQEVPVDNSEVAVDQNNVNDETEANAEDIWKF